MKSIISTLIVIVLVLIGLEIGLRLCGIKPLQIPVYKVKSTPSFAIIPDSELQFRLNSGSFDITINEELKYHATHMDNKRITNLSNALNDSLTKIDFYGCSFTYGQGISDSLTFPFLVSQNLDKLHVNSYAVPAYGTIHCLKLLQKNIKSKNIPKCIVYFYNDFHQSRNTMSLQRQKGILIGYNTHESQLTNELTSNWKFPYGSIKNDSLILNSLSFEELPHIGFYMSQKSSLYHTLFNSFNNDSEEEAISVTIKAIEEMNTLCSLNDVVFILAYMSKPDHDPVIQHFMSSQMRTVNMSIDLDRPGYRNLPYDNHPSEMAATEYAAILEAYLRTIPELN